MYALYIISLACLAMAKDGRLQCEADGAGGRSARLRMENGQLSAKWEIQLNQGQVAGDVVRVAIAGQNVGGILLSNDGTQLEGEQSMSNVPAIQSGTRAQVGSLACTFSED